jgi:hypothetical protein
MIEKKGLLTNSFEKEKKGLLTKSFEVEGSGALKLDGSARAEFIRDKGVAAVTFSASGSTRVIPATPQNLRPRSPSAPPRYGELLLCCILPDKKDREAVIGDLAEEYLIKLSELGKKRAKRWYRSQVIYSIRPFVLEWIRKAILSELRKLALKLVIRLGKCLLRGWLL